MPGFNHQPPSPRAGSCRPTYPRLLGLGLLALTAACGGHVAELSSAEGTGGTGAVAGGIEPPFDSAVDSTGGTGGTGGFSYDADIPLPDAGPDAEPPPDGDIAPPWDAGQEGGDAQVDADPPDAELAGGQPAPFDAGSCEASIEP